MTESKRIVLCADDFGLNPGVSRGILKLVQLDRLSAVSCMVNSPFYKSHSQDLATLKHKVQVGLHFNLTEGHFLSVPDKACFSLNELLIKSHLRLVDTSLILKEFTMQLELFTQTLGKIPDFIDGHQHVHQFPLIRQIVLEYYEENLKAGNTYIRSTYPAFNLPQFRFKGMALALTGGVKLQKALELLSISHNTSFSGIYDFAPSSDYRALFRQWLALIPSGTLMMCHPGEEDLEPDSIAHTREIEMNYFASEEFLKDCQEFNCSVNA
jgi:predicted glycoside hydrolase/deacetylase ChbG (UPF0249 family)